VADFAIPFTEEELKWLIDAVGAAISETETRRNECREWKHLYERLKTYLAK
jgi:hypothetical protein